MAITDFLNTFSIFGIPALVVVIAIVAGVRGIWKSMPDGMIPVVTAIAGIIVAFLIGLIDWQPELAPLVKYILLGLLLGLGGSGLYSQVKKVAGNETVPPGTKVTLPDGSTHIVGD